MHNFYIGIPRCVNKKDMFEMWNSLCTGSCPLTNQVYNIEQVLPSTRSINFTPYACLDMVNRGHYNVGNKNKKHDCFRTFKKMYKFFQIFLWSEFLKNGEVFLCHWGLLVKAEGTLFVSNFTNVASVDPHSFSIQGKLHAFFGFRLKICVWHSSTLLQTSMLKVPYF